MKGGLSFFYEFPLPLETFGSSYLISVSVNRTASHEVETAHSMDKTPEDQRHEQVTHSATASTVASSVKKTFELRCLIPRGSERSYDDLVVILR